MKPLTQPLPDRLMWLGARSVPPTRPALTPSRPFQSFGSRQRRPGTNPHGSRSRSCGAALPSSPVTPLPRTAERALLGAKLGREDLEAGITTVRDLGNSGLNGDVALRRAIQNGWVPGPRMVSSTRALAAQGGQFGPLTPVAQNLIGEEYVTIRSPESARQAVRQALYEGAGCIKVIVNGLPADVTSDEMKAIVEEA